MNRGGFAWNIVTKFIGSILILVGVLGMFVPVVPGFVFVIAGCVMIFGTVAVKNWIGRRELHLRRIMSGR
jgi:uncharacterized protein YqgC (DUF456 family)